MSVCDISYDISEVCTYTHIYICINTFEDDVHVFSSSKPRVTVKKEKKKKKKRERKKEKERERGKIKLQRERESKKSVHADKQAI